MRLFCINKKGSKSSSFAILVGGRFSDTLWNAMEQSTNFADDAIKNLTTVGPEHIFFRPM